MKLLLQERAREASARERLRVETLARLKASLADLLPGQRVWLLGSLVKSGRFAETSDVDIALEHEPESTPLYRLRSLLSERVGREVDIVTLDHCHFAEAIRREGVQWIA